MKKILIAVITLALLLGVMAGSVSAEEPTVNRFCHQCLNWVDWSPWNPGNIATVKSGVPAGHYYLTEDIPSCPQLIIKGIVCIDLNGHTAKTSGRSFLVSRAQMTNPSATERPALSIFDTVGGGMVQATGGTNNPMGGVACISNGGQVNLYSGTLKMVSVAGGANTCGGVVGVYTKNVFNPEFNMYGGVVDASECVLNEDTRNYISSCADGSGGAIAASDTGIINLAGGKVISGKANAIGNGDCVYIENTTCKMILGGNAQVGDIYFNGINGANFAVSGTYTGTANVTFNPEIALSNGMDIGNMELNGNIRGATITCSTPGFFVESDPAELFLSYADPNAEAAVIDGDEITNYDTWEEAFANANGKLVRLNKPISDAVNITEDLYLDLNGYSITGKITVAEGKNLYCLDSETDDFTVADGVYGTLADVTGSVLGLPLEDTHAENAYLMLEEDGAKSFHCIGLQIKAMSLRADKEGIYYKSAFGGDEKVEALVSSYGVALSLKGAPVAENMGTTCKYSQFHTFVAGNKNSNETSTLVRGILKTRYTPEENDRYARMPIYGRAYLKLKDGSYIFGETVSRSLREQMEGVAKIWDNLTIPQKDTVYGMCKTYMSTVENWDVSSILAHKDPTKDDVLKILNISNSHGQDAIWQLPAILKAEMPDQKFVIVEMYAGYALTEHIQAAQNNSPVYYYYINTGGDWQTITTESTIIDGLNTHTWDMIMYNESSRHLGLESKMTHLIDGQTMVKWFRNYILDHIDYDTQIFYDMTWASPTDERFYTDATRQPATVSFKGIYTQDYGFSHVNHYNKLVEWTKKCIVDDPGFDKIIYNATPVQYAGEVLGVPQYDEDQVYDLYRDYTHISDYARLIVAYNLYCQLFDIEELTDIKVDMIRWEDRAPWNNRHKKLGDLPLTEQHKNVLIQSVNHTQKNPLSITAE